MIRFLNRSVHRMIMLIPLRNIKCSTAVGGGHRDALDGFGHGSKLAQGGG